MVYKTILTNPTLRGDVIFPPAAGDEEQGDRNQPQGMLRVLQQRPKDEAGRLSGQGGHIDENENVSFRFVFAFVTGK